MNQDIYAYEITQSLKDSNLINDEEARMITTYLVT
jgi:hypothetical protein